MRVLQRQYYGTSIRQSGRLAGLRDKRGNLCLPPQGVYSITLNWHLVHSVLRIILNVLLLAAIDLRTIIPSSIGRKVTSIPLELIPI